MFGSLRLQVEQARRSDALHFAALLSEQCIDQALGAARAAFQGWLYTPAVMVWCFVAQVLSSDHSCRDTVARLVAHRVSRGQKACSAATGAYCTARDKLPEDFCHRLMTEAGQRVSAAAPQAWRWRGHRVRIADGTTTTMADTPANQREYPQPRSQQPGCGFPILRLVVLLCLATGTVLDAAWGQYRGKRTGETSLFRTLSHHLDPGDVLLVDRYFAGWFDIALLERDGVEVVVRQHASRRVDFRTGTRLGPNDHLIVLPKPARPEWMSVEEYEALPDDLILREVRVVVRQRGFRTRQVIVLTTLTHHELYPCEALAQLYRQRWQAELNLRSLKTVMQMDHLRCKEPRRVRNELRMHLLGYNLLRGVMAEAAAAAGVEPWQVSFKGTLQTINQFLPTLRGADDLAAWCIALLASVASHAVGNRPGRFDPRRRKRRPKNYPLLTKPRLHYKKRCAA